MAGINPAMDVEKLWLYVVMPAHSRPKDGVLAHAYVAGIHVCAALQSQRRGWPE